MWYEILPCVAIMGTLLTLPQVIAHVTATAVYGFPMRRFLENSWDIRMFARDARICDSECWKTRGLENIPDA